MTIKGSLQASIPIVKAFLTRNFHSRRMFAKNLRFGEGNGSKCKILFSRPPKGTSFARNRVIWRIDRENRCRVFGCRLSEEPKKLAESLDAHFRIFGGRRRVIVSWWNFA